jgi:hypothetical protein
LQGRYRLGHRAVGRAYGWLNVQSGRHNPENEESGAHVIGNTEKVFSRSVRLQTNQLCKERTDRMIMANNF